MILDTCLHCMAVRWILKNQDHCFQVFQEMETSVQKFSAGTQTGENVAKSLYCSMNLDAESANMMELWPPERRTDYSRHSRLRIPTDRA